MGGHKELVQTGQSNRSVILVPEVNSDEAVFSNLGVIAFDALKNVHLFTTDELSCTVVSCSVSDSGMSFVLGPPLAITTYLFVFSVSFCCLLCPFTRMTQNHCIEHWKGKKMLLIS
jgi:hypothetical protein